MGDLLEALDEETVEWKASTGLPLPRRRFRWKEHEGWATIQGNAGGQGASKELAESLLL